MKNRVIIPLMLAFIGILLPGHTMQDKKTVSLKMEQVPFTHILKEVERQTGLTFTYEASVLKGLPRTTCEAENEPLELFLNRLFKGHPVTFTITEKFIILKRKNDRINVSGFIHSSNDRESLWGATIIDRISKKGAVSGENGFFSFYLAPGKEVEMEISYTGHQRQRISFPSLTKDTLLTIYLESNNQLKEVVVTGNQEPFHPILSPQMGSMMITGETIRKMPTILGEADVIKTLQTLPGVSAGIEGLAGMYVRGGNGDENLYMLDGAPIYQVNHLGGLFSAFNTNIIDKMDFYKSAFPARYGGRLSSVVDISVKEGDMQEYHGSAMLGLTSGGLHLEGPIVKDRTSFNAALRRSWLDVLTAPALAIYNTKQKKDGEKSTARYAFHDLNLKVTHLFSERSKGTANVYWGQDFLKGGFKEFGGENDSPYETGDLYKLRWGNLLVSTAWTYQLDPKWTLRLTGAFNRYNSRLGKDSWEIYGRKGQEDYTHDKSKTDSQNGIDDLSFQGILEYIPNPSHHIRLGSGYTYHRFRPEYIQDINTSEESHLQDKILKDKLYAHELSIYAEDDWSIGEAIRLNAGLRFSLFSLKEKTYTNLEPRLSARFLVTEDISIKSSWLRTHQYVHQLSESFISLPTDMWLPVTERFKPLISDQVSAGLYYQWNDQYSFSMEGYYKWMKNLLDQKEGYNFLPSYVGWENKLTAGTGRAYGLEWMARKDKGKLTGWLGYSLMWSDRKFAEINEGARFPAKYDNRHKINLVANYQVSKKVELTGSWTYMTGNRMTLSLENYDGMNNGNLPGSLGPIDIWYDDFGLNYYDGKNNFRLPAYHRLDLGINIYRPTKKGRMGIWNISIYNVYSRMNTIGIEKKHWYKGYDIETGKYQRESYFRKLGLFPIIPSVSYTYKF